MLETKTGVEDGATCDIKIFLSNEIKANTRSSNWMRVHLLEAKALGLNHNGLVEVHAVGGHRRSCLFERWVVIFLAAANTTKHGKYFLE